MRRSLTAFVLAAAVITPLTACQAEDGGSTTSQPTSSSSTPSGGQTSAPSGGGSGSGATSDSRSLASVSGYANPSVVTVGSHREGATLSGQRTVNFWRNDGSGWVKDGTSTHVEAHSGSSEPIKIDGKMLPGATHATFILTGSFTGNGTGDAVVYGKDSRGWSVYTAQSDGNLAPSGHDSDLDGVNGLELDIAFTSSGLQTTSMWGSSTTASFAEQRDNPTIRRWKASGSRLTKTSDNVFVASRVTSKPTTQLPANWQWAHGSDIGDGGQMVIIKDADSSAGTLTVCGVDAGSDPCKTLPVSSGARTTILQDNIDGPAAISAPRWTFLSVVAQSKVSDSYFAGSPYTPEADGSLGRDIGGSAYITVKNGTITQAWQQQEKAPN